MRNVEKQCARSVGHIRGAFAGQPEAHVIFRKQHVANATPVVRLVFANPENFGERKVRERGIASELNQALQAECSREIAAYTPMTVVTFIGLPIAMP